MANYLKSLEIAGFKSFPVRTRIEFVDGITGIVGPNGCGKSNVIEAIKWVLGEQSAKSLRGEKMEDVIFNGTKDRQSMGMAEVTLTFNNESRWLGVDYMEVGVSRRMFRSGESQYSMNKNKVRLKDIVELFLDTGVGRDSYAIFEQGKMDRLLAESPIERRTLFEEFAGISKFKFRKEEAEKKLVSAQTNLDRVNDVILELEREVEKLQVQAENAHLYHQYKEKLAELEIKFQALRVFNTKKEIENRTKQKTELEQKLELTKKEMKDRDEALVKTDEDITEREEELQDIQQSFSAAEREFSEIKSRLDASKERKVTQTNWLANMESRLNQETERLTGLRADLASKDKELAEVSTEKETVSGELTDLKAKIDSVFNEIRSIDNNLLEESKKLGYQRIISKDDIEKLKQEIVAYHTRLENFRISLKEKWDINQTLTKEKEEKNEQYEMLSQELDTFRDKLEGIKRDIDDCLNREKAIRDDSRISGEKIKDLQVQLKSMDKVIMESIEKQSALMKDFSRKKPLLEAKLDGALSRLTSAIEQKESSETIREIIADLKKLMTENKSHYENILGILYSDEGTYTKKENLQNEIEELTAHIEDNEQKLEDLRVKLRELQTVRNDIQTGFNRTQMESDTLKRDIQRLDSQMTTTQETLKSIENQINSHSEMIRNKQEMADKLTSIVEDYEKNIQTLRTRKNELGEVQNSKNVSYARVEEKFKSVQTEIARIRSQIRDIERSQESYEKDKLTTLSSIEELSVKIDEDTELMRRKSKTIEEIKYNMERKKTEVTGLRNARRQIEIQIKDSNTGLQKIESQIGEIERSIAERRGSMEAIMESARNTYSIDVTQIPISPDDNADKLHKAIREMTAELQKLGDVNLLAIEQYQDAKDRLEFLSRQREDVMKAIEDINMLIQETNERSISQFTEAFEQIRKAFKKTFARLFDGGRADLILIDEKDVLNSGVDILAEPPGKKFQSVSLLSGGERALVTIAVIFAILYLKPTPFVILDELDAPLDDDNIERFKAILKDFRQMSQFIVVSHSKSTLEVCDALYGVTMEELGVSKVVNVAFDDANVLFKQLEGEEPYSRKEE